MSHLEPRMKRTLALQVALDRAGFSPGEIDAYSGGDTERALRAFQQAHDLHVTGELDRHTVQALGQPFVRSVMTYRVTADDIARSFVYSSVAELLAERFHTSPALLRYMNADVEFEDGETLIVPNVWPGAATGHPALPVVVTVAERAHMLSVQDASGDVIFHAPVTTAADRHALHVEPSCLSRVHAGGIRLTSWDAMRLACLMNGTATVIMR